MSKTLIGIVTFGNTKFSRLTVNSIKSTTKSDVDFFIVVGKPGDRETVKWLEENPEIKFKVHDQNYGFPYSINDIYDHAWKDNNYDYLIIAGNDVVAYPYCVDSLIKLADTSDYEVISALQYDVKTLIHDYPDAKRFFHGNDYIFNDFEETPWNYYNGYKEELEISDMSLCDIQNFCLYKKSIFDKVGYTDVNFFPAYYIDNDYARRIVNSGARSCSVLSARFFHFWSRTIKQESGGSTNKNFENNRNYYKRKWHGDFGHETVHAPIKIDTRVGELDVINKWRKLG